MRLKSNPESPCWDCYSATETNGQWVRFDSLKCPYCSARLIQALGRLNMRQGETHQTHRERISARRKAVLDDSVAAGLSEALIRDLVKGKMAVEPVKGKRD